HLLSTETLTIVPDGHPYTRFQKTERITHYPPTYEFLEVAPPDDTGKQPTSRPKSIRVLSSLDTLDKLHLYSRIFDLEKYKRRRFYIRSQVIVGYKSREPFSIDIVEHSRLYGKKFPNYLVALLLCKAVSTYAKIRYTYRSEERR